MAVPSKPTPSLLGVPREIRDKIYECLFEDSIILGDQIGPVRHGFEMPYSTPYYNIRYFNGKMPAIFLVCKLICAEARLVFAKTVPVTFVTEYAPIMRSDWVDGLRRNITNFKARQVPKWILDGTEEVILGMGNSMIDPGVVPNLKTLHLFNRDSDLLHSDDVDVMAILTADSDDWCSNVLQSGPSFRILVRSSYNYLEHSRWYDEWYDDEGPNAVVVGMKEGLVTRYTVSGAKVLDMPWEERVQYDIDLLYLLKNHGYTYDNWIDGIENETASSNRILSFLQRDSPLMNEVQFGIWKAHLVSRKGIFDDFSFEVGCFSG